MTRRHPRSTLFPYTTLFRSVEQDATADHTVVEQLDRLDLGALARRDQVAGAAVVDASVPEVMRRRVHVGDRVAEIGKHTSELQSPDHLVCRLLLEKKKKKEI